MYYKNVFIKRTRNKNSVAKQKRNVYYLFDLPLLSENTAYKWCP